LLGWEPDIEPGERHEPGERQGKQQRIRLVVAKEEEQVEAESSPKAERMSRLYVPESNLPQRRLNCVDRVSLANVSRLLKEIDTHPFLFPTNQGQVLSLWDGRKREQHQAVVMEDLMEVPHDVDIFLDVFQHITTGDQVHALFRLKREQIAFAELKVLQLQPFLNGLRDTTPFVVQFDSENSPILEFLRQVHSQVSASAARVKNAKIVTGRKAKRSHPSEHMMDSQPAWHMEFTEKCVTNAFERVGFCVAFLGADQMLALLDEVSVR
jgi:hypothetical protein